MAESYAFRVVGLAPHDVRYILGGDALHRSFWREVVRWVLEVKDQELAAGLDRFGKPLIPIAESTRKKGRWRSHTGKGSASNPPLTPALILSRTRSLFAGRAKADHAEFYWKYDPVSGRNWGVILGYHRAGAGRLPVRDVIGLSPKSMAKLKARAELWWREHLAAENLTLHPGATSAGRPIPERPRPIAVTGSIDLSRYTFGIGAGEEQVKASIDAGQFTGFRKRSGPYKPYGGGPAAPKPAPPKPPARPTPTRTIPLPPPRPSRTPTAPLVAKAGKPSRPGEAIPPRPPTVRFEKHPLDVGDVTVIADVAKLDVPLRQRSGHGSSNPTDEGRERFEEFLEKAKAEDIPIHQPRITLDRQKLPVIEDGRHRFATFRDLGFGSLPISVPKRIAAIFRKLFGVK